MPRWPIGVVDTTTPSRTPGPGTAPVCWNRLSPTGAAPPTRRAVPATGGRGDGGRLRSAGRLSPTNTGLERDREGAAGLRQRRARRDDVVHDDDRTRRNATAGQGTAEIVPALASRECRLVPGLAHMGEHALDRGAPTAIDQDSGRHLSDSAPSVLPATTSRSRRRRNRDDGNRVAVTSGRGLDRAGQRDRQRRGSIATATLLPRGDDRPSDTRVLAHHVRPRPGCGCRRRSMKSRDPEQEGIAGRAHALSGQAASGTGDGCTQSDHLASDVT